MRQAAQATRDGQGPRGRVAVKQVGEREEKQIEVREKNVSSGMSDVHRRRG